MLGSGADLISVLDAVSSNVRDATDVVACALEETSTRRRDASVDVENEVDGVALSCFFLSFSSFLFFLFWLPEA